MGGEASWADNGLAYLSLSLLCSRAIARSVLDRPMKTERVQGNELEKWGEASRADKRLVY